RRAPGRDRLPSLGARSLGRRLVRVPAVQRALARRPGARRLQRGRGHARPGRPRLSPRLPRHARAAARRAGRPARLGGVRPAGARGAHAARFGRAAEPVARYLAALERVMAEVVTYGDVLLPPAEAARAAAVRAALAATRRQAPELRRLLAAAPAARAAEEPLLEYTFAVLEALERWLAAAGPEARDAARAA